MGKLLCSGDKIPSVTLVTKIMLGVFGSVPAFDTNFRAGIGYHFDIKEGFTSFNEKSLIRLSEIYEKNKDDIDDLSKEYKTIDFETYKEPVFYYTKAKILDMYGFMKGMEVIEKRKLDKEREKKLRKNSVISHIG